MYYWLLVTPGAAIAGVSTDIAKIGIGARAMGMGGVGVAIADEGSSAFLNPAGLGWTKSYRLTSMYTTLLSEVSYNEAVLIYPTKWGLSN